MVGLPYFCGFPGPDCIRGVCVVFVQVGVGMGM